MLDKHWEKFITRSIKQVTLSPCQLYEYALVRIISITRLRFQTLDLKGFYSHPTFLNKLVVYRVNNHERLVCVNAIGLILTYRLQDPIDRPPGSTCYVTERTLVVKLWFFQGTPVPATWKDYNNIMCCICQKYFYLI